jgi:hypothetical protein
MAVEETRTINLDMMSGILLLLGKMPGILAFRDEIKAKLVDFDITHLDMLPDATRAAQHAHGLYLQATKAPGPFQNLVDEAESMRDVLYADGVALGKRGFINIDSLREVKRTTGHRTLILDLQILHATFDQRLGELTGRTSVTRGELDRVQALIDTLSEAVGTKENSEAAQEQATIVRAKAFALLMDYYDEVRAGIAWLRRKHGDADKIAPSLYVTRPNSRRPNEEPGDAASTGVHPVVAAAAPAPDGPSTTDLSASVAQSAPFRRSGSEG